MGQSQGANPVQVCVSQPQTGWHVEGATEAAVRKVPSSGSSMSSGALPGRNGSRGEPFRRPQGPLLCTGTCCENEYVTEVVRECGCEERADALDCSNAFTMVDTVWGGAPEAVVERTDCDLYYDGTCMQFGQDAIPLHVGIETPTSGYWSSESKKIPCRIAQRGTVVLIYDPAGLPMLEGRRLPSGQIKGTMNRGGVRVGIFELAPRVAKSHFDHAVVAPRRMPRGGNLALVGTPGMPVQTLSSPPEPAVEFPVSPSAFGYRVSGDAAQGMFGEHGTNSYSYGSEMAEPHFHIHDGALSDEEFGGHGNVLPLPSAEPMELGAAAALTTESARFHAGGGSPGHVRLGEQGAPPPSTSTTQIGYMIRRSDARGPAREDSRGSHVPSADSRGSQVSSETARLLRESGVDVVRAESAAHQDRQHPFVAAHGQSAIGAWLRDRDEWVPAEAERRPLGTGQLSPASRREEAEYVPTVWGSEDYMDDSPSYYELDLGERHLHAAERSPRQLERPVVPVVSSDPTPPTSPSGPTQRPAVGSVQALAGQHSQARPQPGSVPVPQAGSVAALAAQHESLATAGGARDASDDFADTSGPRSGMPTKEEVVFIKPPWGQEFAIHCSGSTVVFALKMLIEDHLGVSGAAQKLSFNGVVLQDEFELSEYGVQPGATVDFDYVESSDV